MPQIVGSRPAWGTYTVYVSLPPRVVAARCRCRDKDRKNGSAMAAFVKVFQVERIVPCLVIGSWTELMFPAFELNWKDRWARYQDCVDSTSEPWNVEFKIDGSRQRRRGRFENANFLFPCAALFQLQIEFGCGG